MSTGNASMPDAIVCSHIDKRFGGTHALKDVSLSVAAGSIHALVGENGAGKSTLLGVFSGRVTPDAGALLIHGQPLAGRGPRQLRTAGVAMIYQELMMVPTLTAEENVFLGMQPTRGAFVDRKLRRHEFLRLCSELDVDIPPASAIRSLSIAQQQLVEIMRGMAAQSRILLLDEPTAALAEREREVLHRVVRDLSSRGITVAFVSHNLDEVLELATRVSVMRDGELVADAPSSEWTKRDLIAAMVGRTVDFPDRPTSVTETVVLRARSVTVRPSAPRIDISVRQGEIVGMWGLVGSGRTTFLRSLAGLEPTSSGELQLLGRSVPWPRRPVDSQRAGISLLAEDRRQSLVRSMNAVDNYWIGNGHSSLGLIRRRRERTEAQAQVKRFAFDERRLNAPVGRLSGGNQQKALLAKWAGRRPSVLLIDEPTRGIDIGAKAEVLESLSALANEGAAIVMTSSELEEVLHLSDRILVFADGAVVAEIPRGSEGFDVQSIVHQGFKSEASE